MTLEQDIEHDNQALLDPSRKASLEGVKRASAKLSKILPRTPLLPIDIKNKTIWCKAESLQPSGAFKIRGAWHRLSDLTDEEKTSGVVAFSSGNHAQGVAWAAKKLDIKASIIMPHDAPKLKMDNTAALGAKIITYDRMKESREEIAAQISQDTGAIIVPSFDDPWIIEGQGSTMLEAEEQFLELGVGSIDTIIACCGGGGLASGSALAIPNANIMVVEPDGWDDMKQSLHKGEIQSVGKNPPKTACDALQTLRVADSTFEILHARNARAISVSETEVEDAMRFAFEKLHLVIEPGGAVALAAILSNKAEIHGNIIITLSGGNVDKVKFAKIMRR